MAFLSFYEHKLEKCIRKIVKSISNIRANFIGHCVSFLYLPIYTEYYVLIPFTPPHYFPYLPKSKTEDFYPSNVVILFCIL